MRQRLIILLLLATSHGACAWLWGLFGGREAASDIWGDDSDSFAASPEALMLAASWASGDHGAGFAVSMAASAAATAAAARAEAAVRPGELSQKEIAAAEGRKNSYGDKVFTPCSSVRFSFVPRPTCLRRFLLPVPTRSCGTTPRDQRRGARAATACGGGPHWGERLARQAVGGQPP